MRAWIACVIAVVSCAAFVVAQTRDAKTLDVYVVDVEGGNATLFVAPSGESLLIDTGNGGAAAVRDAERILGAARDAGVARIDHLITTHYHGDHVGGLAELAARMPIRHFIDHGPSVQPNAAVDAFLQKSYPELYSKAKHTVAKPGDRIPVAGLDVRVVTSAAEIIKTPLPGAGRPNPYCATFKPHVVNPVSGQPTGNTEDEQSVGSHITFGKFRALYLGDFTWNQEFDLMCPTNRIGTVDLFVVSRHGQPSSNSEALVHAIRPRVAIMNNGPRKGGQPDAMRVLYSAPGLEDLWQIHFSVLGGQEHTAPGLFIANPFDEQPPTMPVAAMALPQPAAGAPPAPQHNGAAHWIKLSARTDGSFTVTNSRNGFSKTYGVD
ncbi:MAG: MBL fold metallo-hydrolase [Acidobacteria bacterium]|nr:MBL fold metallo-hydrolase [Acidobacteriota bacterium]